MIGVVPSRKTLPPSTGNKNALMMKNGINHILWPVQSLDLSLTEYLQDFGLVCAAGAGESCLTAVEGIFCVLPSYLVFSHKPKVVLHPDDARVSSVCVKISSITHPPPRLWEHFPAYKIHQWSQFLFVCLKFKFIY